MKKIDYKKKLRSFYNASRVKPATVTLPPMNYLMFSGEGHPSAQPFQDSAKALFTTAYTLKFLVREHIELDYNVMPMEVIWQINRQERGQLQWTMMILQPECTTPQLFTKAIRKVRLKLDSTLSEKVRFETLEEGPCVQMLHVGPYEAMNNTFKVMKNFIQAANLTAKSQDTHDIYLNNSLKTKPENLRTIMRLPVA